MYFRKRVVPPVRAADEAPKPPPPGRFAKRAPPGSLELTTKARADAPADPKPDIVSPTPEIALAKPVLPAMSLVVPKPETTKPAPKLVLKKPAAKPPQASSVTKSRPPADAPMPPDYAASVARQSYLGRRGYTIPKSALTPDDLARVIAELTVRPKTFGPSYGAAQETAFPVWRESAKKLYVPRFYGEKRYGLPPRTEIAARGADIHPDVQFTAELRDYQNEIVDVYMRHASAPLTAAPDAGVGNGGILEVKTGRGKCLGIDTPVLMFDGTIKPVQDVVVGDKLMGDDSTPRSVLSLARGRETMYRVETSSDEAYVVNKSHILSLKHGAMPRAGVDRVVDICVADFVEMPVPDLYGYRVPVDFPESDVHIPPYSVGLRLGGFRTLNDFMCSPFYDRSGLLGVRVPRSYKINCRRVHLQLLAGLADACGRASDDGYEFVLSGLSDTLSADVCFVARAAGLGASASYSDRTSYKKIFSVRLFGRGLSKVPVRVLARAKEPRDVSADHLLYALHVVELEEDDYFGFEIDGNHRFMLGDFTVTHNTVMAIKIISLMRQKTLIIVHKEFLADQWTERIAEFMPAARVGRIQGARFETENKDVVIGMVQTLYSREFAPDAFADFGLTIIDEVHRIGSEEFSKTLLRIVTPNMLGISATVDRKDGLERLLYMFIGDKIYKDASASEDPVCVRAIEYVCADPEFNETALDFRGNPAFSTMISKLCEFAPRTEFALRVIRDLVTESPDAQIMVLAHQRNLLSYLFAAIESRGIASVGFYVGGMKQAALKETEGRQIVLATFSMAAEALDIKTLSTLFMVSPKSDIVQSVGRILRAKHATPIIVDLVDRHDMFKAQFGKRRTFYRKNNYRIRSVCSTEYRGFADMAHWKIVFEPRRGHAQALVETTEDDEEDEDAPPPPPAVCMLSLGEDEVV